MQERSAWQYYSDCFTQNYANFEGRARRSEYWYFVLFNFLVTMGISLVLGVIGGLLGVPELAFGYLIYSLAALVPGLAVAIRRLHDNDKSGWMILIGLIPLIGSIVLIVFFCTEGTRGPNQYGPDPKSADVFDEI